MLILYVCMYVFYVASSSLRQATEGSRCGDAEGGPTCGQDDQSGANSTLIRTYTTKSQSYIDVVRIDCSKFNDVCTAVVRS